VPGPLDAIERLADVRGVAAKRSDERSFLEHAGRCPPTSSYGRNEDDKNPLVRFSTFGQQD
jgi:hypothetical protein